MSVDVSRGPQPDLDSAPFWDGLRRHAVIVQECDDCGRRRFGRLGSCPYCGVPGGTDVEVAGTGTVYSFVRIHRALTPEMAGEVPYTVGTIELDGPAAGVAGPRLLGRVEPAGDVAIGSRVRPTFVDHPSWTELRFVVEP